ncbi:hypothetical protein ABZ297_12415 [Nonomuraea sp. NPDC005983]|uniref:hypothetical protein n=1 Tax=Nonomuraea sp. NPDC005983 TaxID=3155595 RepID=UPI0033AB8F2C
MMITSAVVAMVAVLVMLTLAKNRRRTRSAVAAYMAPSPSTPVARHSADEPDEPDEGSLWRRELLEAIEAAAALPFDTIAPDEQDSDPPEAPAPTGQPNRRPETGPSRPDSGLGPQEEPAALTEPLEVVINTGPLERIVIPAATTPFDAFTSDGPTDGPTDGSVPEPTYRGRRRRSEDAAGDEGVAADDPAEGKPSSAPGTSGDV